MDYEKKYKEALERAKEEFYASNSFGKGTIEYIFPELKESEDEKIRKELITHCRNTRCVTEEGAERIAKWIDWLEKQGEQKPWSEEDEELLGRIRSIVEKYAFSQSAVDVNGDLCEQEYIGADNWLKSLKQRIGGK